MALSNAESEPTIRVPFSNPMVKSEVDDILGQIGGMTRLVMKGSTASPPYVAPISPQSQHSSTGPNSPTHYIPVPDSAPNSTWQYHHVQPTNDSLNVPMEIFPDSYSPVDMVQDGINGGNIRTDEIRLLYEQQQHQQPHLGPNVQQVPAHLHPSGPQDFPSGMEHIPPAPPAQYHALFGSSMAGLYGQHHLFGGHGPLMQSSNNIQCMNNPQELWQNFEAQYKP
jgi:hypothetical protein